MDIQNAQQNISVNSISAKANSSSSVRKTTGSNFADELKKIEKDKDDKNLKTEETKKTQQTKESEKADKENKTEKTKEAEKTEKEGENKSDGVSDAEDKDKKAEDVKPAEQTKKEQQENPQEDADKKPNDGSLNNAVNGLQQVVSELNKIGQKEDNNKNFLKNDPNSADKKNTDEDSLLIDNNLNINEPQEKLKLQTETNTNFNNGGQPFSEFVMQDKTKNELGTKASDIAEEKAVLSTMEENLAIAKKNMMLKEKAKTKNDTVLQKDVKDISEETETDQKAKNATKTVHNDKGIKKVNTKTNITIDTIVSYRDIVMDKSDVDFFVNLVNNGSVNLNEVQNAQKSSQVSKTLADLLAKSMSDNKPVRIDFDNDISVIIKIDRAGKISADFLPSSQIAEAYLKENLPILRQRFDDNNINYNELNQRRQKQDSQNNRRKGRNDE